MEIQTITTADGLRDLRHDWERLENSAPDVPYYVHHRFVQAWWDAFASKGDISLHVVCIVHNGKVVAIAPFSLHQQVGKKGPQTMLRFASHGDYLDVLIDGDAQVNADTICKELMAYLDSDDAEWTRLSLTNMPGSSRFTAYLFKSRYNSQLSYHIENPYIDLSGYDDVEDIERQVVPKGARKYRNRLLRECDPSFVVVRGDEGGVLERIASLHRAEKEHLIRSQGRLERHSLFDDPFRAKHVRNVFENTDDAITFMYELPDGSLLGYRTCYQHGRVLLSWNSAYNPDYEHLRVGKALQYDILRHIHEQDLADRFDLGAGRYAWKFEWTGSFTTTYRLRVDRARVQPTERPQQQPTEEVQHAEADASATAEPADDDTSRASSPGPPPSLPAGGKILIGAGLALLRRAVRIMRLSRSRTPLPARLRPLRALDRSRSTTTAGGSDDPTIQSTTVWYVPHPDDETLFMAGSIWQNRKNNNVVVLLTQGGASNAINKISKKLPRPLGAEEFMESRVREFRAATASLGLERGDVIMFDHPDGALRSADIYEIVLNMARQYPGARHDTMSYLDPHPDHRAAGEAVKRAYEEGHISDCQFHLPIPVVDESLGQRVAFDDEGAAEAKQSALREYARWDPDRGRYAVGTHSVASLMKRQTEAPTERTHGPDYVA